jgi:hypothetical protein
MGNFGSVNVPTYSIHSFDTMKRLCNVMYRLSSFF